jgi:hypothetical protein
MRDEKINIINGTQSKLIFEFQRHTSRQQQQRVKQHRIPLERERASERKIERWKWKEERTKGKRERTSSSVLPFTTSHLLRSEQPLWQSEENNSGKNISENKVFFLLSSPLSLWMVKDESRKDKTVWDFLLLHTHTQKAYTRSDYRTIPYQHMQSEDRERKRKNYSISLCCALLISGSSSRLLLAHIHMLMANTQSLRFFFGGLRIFLRFHMKNSFLLLLLRCRW